MIVDGMRLMALGMTMVFLYLLLLVFMINTSAWLLARYFPEAPIPAPADRRPTTAQDRHPVDRVAAAVAAIHRHRALQQQR